MCSPRSHPYSLSHQLPISPLYSFYFSHSPFSLSYTLSVLPLYRSPLYFLSLSFPFLFLYALCLPVSLNNLFLSIFVPVLPISSPLPLPLHHSSTILSSLFSLPVCRFCLPSYLSEVYPALRPLHLSFFLGPLTSIFSSVSLLPSYHFLATVYNSCEFWLTDVLHGGEILFIKITGIGSSKFNVAQRFYSLLYNTEVSDALPLCNTAGSHDYEL